MSPKISWKLQVVLTWGQRQVVLYPKDSNIWKNDSFWTGRNLVVLKGLNVEPSNLVFSKTYNTEFDGIIIAFMDQDGRLLEIEDRVSLTLHINK